MLEEISIKINLDNLSLAATTRLIISGLINAMEQLEMDNITLEELKDIIEEAHNGKKHSMERSKN